MKYVVGAPIAIAAILVVGFTVISAAMMASRGGHTAEQPHVTIGPGDQKANMGLYDDASGPPYSGIPHVGVIHMPFGLCAKPGVVLDRDQHSNELYAEDDQVIWRCVQTAPNGALSGAPNVYCHLQYEQPLGSVIAWRCHHNYAAVFAWYEHEYGEAPFVLPDEIRFIDMSYYQREP